MTDRQTDRYRVIDDCVDRSELESVNSELNECLTSLKSDNDSLMSQLSDANAALARVQLVSASTTVAMCHC